MRIVVMTVWLYVLAAIFSTNGKSEFCYESAHWDGKRWQYGDWTCID